MYHLKFRSLSAAVLLNTMLLVGIPAQALIVAGAPPADFSLAHSAGDDSSVDISDHFLDDFANGTVVYSAAVVSGGTRLSVSVVGSTLIIDPTEDVTTGIETIELRAADDDGPAAPLTFDVTITNQVPTLSIGALVINEGDPLTFNAGASDPDDAAPGDLSYAIAGQPPGATITADGDFSWTPTESQGQGTYNVTFQVVDGAFQLGAELVAITVNEVDEPPVVDPIGPFSVDELDTLAFTATATDPDLPANTLTFSLGGGAPPGAAITAGGDFTWTPTEAQGPGAGPYNVTIEVADGTGQTGSTIVAITVDEVDEPPVVAPLGPFSVDEGDTLAFTATATDPDLPANTLTFSLGGGAPSGAAITAGGDFTWTPTEAQGPGAGPYNVTIEVADGTGQTGSTIVAITVDEVDEPPVVAPLGPFSVDEGDTLAFTATATDPDLPANTWTFSLGGGAPPGAAITAGGDFTWTPTEAQGPSAGPYNVTIQATDNTTQTGSTVVAITVNEVNEPPTVVPVADQIIDEGSSLAFTVTATDPDAPANALTYILEPGAPAGATITPTGDFEWTPAEADGPGSATVTVRVTDDGTPALSATDSFDITINEANAPPVLASIGDQLINEETTLNFTATATDGDVPANGLTYTLDAGAPATATITPGGDFSWTPAEADGPGSFPVTIRVTDDGIPAAEDSETITITVVEINDPPTLVGDVIDLPMNEDDSTAFVEVRAEFDDPDLGDTPPDTLNVVLLPGYDAALVDVAVSGTGVNVTPQLHQFGTTTVTVGVEDGAGVQATDTFEVTVADVNDPVTVAAGLSNVVAPEDIGGISVDITGAFADVDLANGGDSHTVTVVSSDPALIDATNSPLPGLTGMINFAVTPDANGPATITVTAEDADGAQAITSFAVTITPATDAPYVENPIADVNLLEDPGLQTSSIAAVFNDVDIINGDSLTYSVVTDNPTLIPAAWISGTTLNLDIGPDQNGVANVTVTAEDSTGQTVSDDFVVTVAAVNDDPYLVTTLFNVNAAEDDPTTFTWDLATVFDDVDIATNGDALTFSMSNSNTSLFDVSELVGSVISFHLAPDQNGNATITVTAKDLDGATESTSFDFIIAGVNDFPVASDDILGPFNEDPGTIVIPVLDNDYLAEGPTSINTAGVGGFSEGTPTVVLDPFDDPIADPNGTVAIVGNQIEYTPKEDFFGVDEFYYTIIDSNGDISPPARVEITILEVNDPPVGTQQRTFSIYENQTLFVDPADGVLNGYYDVDGALLDPMGDPVGSPITAVLQPPAPIGSMFFDSASGAFIYTPPINFIGEVVFFYRLFDGIDFSAGTDYEVRVVVNPTPSAPPPPPPGSVAINYDISNIPLEQTNNVPPNVMVVLDDSGSMDWNMVVDSTDPNGKVVLNNRDARSSGSDSTSYVYLWNLPTNQYGFNNNNGRILPTEEGLAGDTDTDNNEYGVWRARNYKYNSIYYNPNVLYRPWIGQDVNNNDFTDASIQWGAPGAAAISSAIRLEPRDPTNTFDILAMHSYDSTRVPQWDSNGGRETIGDGPDQSVYIPRYYTTPEDAPLEWDDPHTLVEITPGNAPFPAANGREDCAADGIPATCSYEEELQNFANWFQYYRSREYVTKASLGRVIAEVQDIRLGLETLNGSERERIRDMNELYTEGNKKLFLDDLYDTNSSGGTPLRDALRDTGEIFARQWQLQSDPAGSGRHVSAELRAAVLGWLLEWCCWYQRQRRQQHSE